MTIWMVAEYYDNGRYDPVLWYTTKAHADAAHTRLREATPPGTYPWPCWEVIAVKAASPRLITGYDRERGQKVPAAQRVQR